MLDYFLAKVWLKELQVYDGTDDPTANPGNIEQRNHPRIPSSNWSRLGLVGLTS